MESGSGTQEPAVISAHVNGEGQQAENGSHQHMGSLAPNDRPGAATEHPLVIHQEDPELESMRFVDLIEEDNISDDNTVHDDDQLNAQALADLANLHFGTQECYICFEDVQLFKVLQLTCGEHWICHECIAEPFELAIKQESLYPPKCCNNTGPLKIEDFEHLLAKDHPDLPARYESKLQEYHMEKRFRRYCGVEDCHTFLNPDNYEQNDEHKLTTADCPQCNRTTCIFCTKVVFKDMSHNCEPEITKLNKDYSVEARFKNCPYCERPGLLDEGCNHVTCDCGEEWCFICLRKWNSGRNHHECGQYNVC